MYHSVNHEQESGWKAITPKNLVSGAVGWGGGGLKLICEVLRGDIRVTTLRPYIQLIMGLIA